MCRRVLESDLLPRNATNQAASSSAFLETAARGSLCIFITTVPSKSDVFSSHYIRRVRKLNTGHKESNGGYKYVRTYSKRGVTQVLVYWPQTRLQGIAIP